VNHIAAGILKFGRIKPVSCVFFDGDKSAGPLREEELEVSVSPAGALPARRSQHLRIDARATQNGAAVSTKGKRGRTFSRRERELPSAAGWNQHAPANNVSVCEIVEDRIGLSAKTVPAIDAHWPCGILEYTRNIIQKSRGVV
jgi:hypothetical protein